MEGSAGAPLQCAVRSYQDLHEFYQLLQCLIEHNVDLNAISSSTGECALYTGLHLNKPPFAIKLIQEGADSNIECPNDFTILYKACQKQLHSVVCILLHTAIDWSRETWLHTDIHTSGINPKLLSGYAENIPMILLHDVELFFMIQDARSNPPKLVDVCRICIRRELRNQLWRKIQQLELPERLKDFLMMKILWPVNSRQWELRKSSHEYDRRLIS